MIHEDFGKPMRLPLGRRVPGVPCSLFIALGCLALSSLIAWRHPLVTLTCAPRGIQPPGNGSGQRVIMDGQVTRRLWGLFTVGREELRSVSHFSMHTTTSASGGHTESLHALTSDGSCEVFSGAPPGLLRHVTLLNSQLDGPSTAALGLRRTHWTWFVASWIFLLLGALVFVRNVLVELWQRRRIRAPIGRG